MEKRVFYNVGHGEAIFIELSIDKPYRGIVRDLGCSRGSISTCYTMPLESLLKGNSCRRFDFISQYFFFTRCNQPPCHSKCNIMLDAVLSHAHEDHFNGFKMLYDNKITKIFQNGFIPWLRMDDLDSLGGILIKYSLLLFKYYRSPDIKADNAKHWLLAAPIMATLSENLWCVSAGYKVPNWPQGIILWPPPNPPEELYEEKLKRRWTEYIEANGLSSNFLNEDAEKIRKILVDYYRGINETEGGHHDVEQTRSAINRINETLNAPLDKERKELTPPYRLYKYSYCPTIDNHSLIFEVGNGDVSLYLSDADGSTVKRMLEDRHLNNKHYLLIKSGHHGNRGANPLNKKNITSDYVVNCCGPTRLKWGGPDIAYKKIAVKDVYCTDWDDRNDMKHKWKDKDKYIILKACCVRL